MSGIPYSTQQITEDDIAAVTRVLRSDWLTQGPVLPAFEAAFAERHATAHAIAVSNATAGLHLACLALGVGPGSRVWTSPNSFVASANCALYCGAEVDFVDIDPATRNLSINALQAKLELARRSNRLPTVVIPVDFAGLPCDLPAMRQLADRYGFRILADASHATGASLLDQPVGSAWVDAAVFSFHAVKVITSGEGGMVTTQDPALAARLRALRSHGVTRESEHFESPAAAAAGPWYYEQQSLGHNARMCELQAALGLSQLQRLDEMQARRAALAARYDQLLAQLPLRLPVQPTDRTCSWHLYAVEVDPTAPATRAATFAALRQAGIGVNVHYIPIHTQPHYRRLGFEVSAFPNAEAYYAQALSLPLFPAMTNAQQDQVVACLRSVLA